MPDLAKRRRWDVELDGRPHVVEVEYAMLSGFMNSTLRALLGLVAVVAVVTFVWTVLRS